MTTDELRQRTKQFALRVIRLVEALPNTKTGRAVGNQFVRCGTSVAANYRAACRARSRADFASKICVVEEEADESAFWLELVIEARLFSEKRVIALWKEADQLVAIMTASGRTARRRNGMPASGNRRTKSAIQNPQSAIV